MNDWVAQPPEESYAPALGEPTVRRTVAPDEVTEEIAVWWDGTSMDDIAWVEIIFGPHNWRTTGERRVDVKARPLTLGGIEFAAPTWQPDPATLEIRVARDPERWEPVPLGVWLTGRRPYQPKVRIATEQVLAGLDPSIARLRDAVIEGKAETSMTIERKREESE